MTSVLSANPSARISTDLAGPDLWSVADGPVISRATIHVALQPVHHDSGTRSHTRAAALVRGVLTIPVGSARSSSARKCSPRRHPLPHRYALGSLLLGALVFGMQVLTTAPSSSPQVRGRLLHLHVLPPSHLPPRLPLDAHQVTLASFVSRSRRARNGVHVHDPQGARLPRRSVPLSGVGLFFCSHRRCARRYDRHNAATRDLVG